MDDMHGIQNMKKCLSCYTYRIDFSDKLIKWIQTAEVFMSLVNLKTIPHLTVDSYTKFINSFVNSIKQDKGKQSAAKIT